MNRLVSLCKDFEYTLYAISPIVLNSFKVYSLIHSIHYSIFQLFPQSKEIYCPLTFYTIYVSTFPNWNFDQLVIELHWILHLIGYCWGPNLNPKSYVEYLNNWTFINDSCNIIKCFRETYIIHRHLVSFHLNSSSHEYCADNEYLFGYINYTLPTCHDFYQ